jgi:hypothetical protein
MGTLCGMGHSALHKKLRLVSAELFLADVIVVVFIPSTSISLFSYGLFSE